MTFRAPYEPPTKTTYRWVHAPGWWLRTPVADTDPFRKYLLRLHAEALVRNVPLAIVYHGQVRGDAAPDKVETTERRVLEEGRQMVRWQDNAGRNQRKGLLTTGSNVASQNRWRPVR